MEGGSARRERMTGQHHGCRDSHHAFKSQVQRPDDALNGLCLHLQTLEVSPNAFSGRSR